MRPFAVETNAVRLECVAEAMVLRASDSRCLVADESVRGRWDCAW